VPGGVTLIRIADWMTPADLNSRFKQACQTDRHGQAWEGGKKQLLDRSFEHKILGGIA
jgi:hypothetical protein